MDFAVFDCNHTARLCDEATDAGFTVWVPKCLQKVRLRGATTDTLEERVPEECRGYIFVSFDEKSLFRKWARPRYYVELHTTYQGPSDLQGPERAWYFEPYRLDEEQVLTYSEQLVRESQMLRTRKEGPPQRKPGDHVLVIDGLLEDSYGVVLRVGKKQVLVQIGVRKVWLSADILG